MWVTGKHVLQLLQDVWTEDTQHSDPSIDVHQSLAATGKGDHPQTGPCVSCWADLVWRVHTDETVQTPGDTVSQGWWDGANCCQRIRLKLTSVVEKKKKKKKMMLALSGWVCLNQQIATVMSADGRWDSPGSAASCFSFSHRWCWEEKRFSLI